MLAKMRNRRQANVSSANKAREQDDHRPQSVATTSSDLFKSSGARLPKGTNPTAVPRGAQPLSLLPFKTFHTAGSTSSLPQPARPFATADRPSTCHDTSASTSLYGDPSGNSSSVSLLPPVLPPIPRVASVYGKSPSLTLVDFEEKAKHREREEIAEQENTLNFPHGPTSGISSASAPSSSRISSLPQPGPKVASQKMDPSFFSNAPTEGRMQATMFPTSTPTSPPQQDTPDRAFVDRRDRSYYSMSPPRLTNPESHPPRSSSMLSVRSSSNTNPSTPNSFAANAVPGVRGGHPGQSSVLSANNPALSSRPSALNEAQRSYSQLNSALSPPSHALSQPCLRDSPSTRPILTGARSDSDLIASAQDPIRPLTAKGPYAVRTGSSNSSTNIISTLGTPYQETSPSFPLPQHVATRPQTSGVKASIAGIAVPTHHTSSSALKNVPKPEGKRKTRLLRPMAFLSRKRSGQDAESTIKPSDHERTAQEQAFARQKSVAVIGVKRIPEDFDPRIKGNVVHDFSSPRRATRTSSILKGDPLLHQRNTSASLTNSAANGIAHSKQASMASSRLSTHSPIFREHLEDDHDHDRRASLLDAETRENKQFVQRVSRQSVHGALSQDASALPPFARRSQQSDPLQISMDADTHRSSAGSSDPTRHSKQESVASSLSLLSPITTRNSMLAGYSEGASPASPSSARHSSPVEGYAKPFFKNVPQSSIVEPSQEKHKSVSEIRELSVISQDELPSTPAKGIRSDGQSPSISLVSPNVDPEAPITVAKRATSSGASKSPTTPSKKRGSAVKHPLRGSTPKHHASNASRFSFQFGERNAEEAALEEKHRKTVGPSVQPTRAFSPYDDEDDYFDEDAMDDMDEMELQEQQTFGVQAPVHSAAQNGAWNMQDARRQMQADSDEDSNDSLYEERPNTGYSWQQTPQNDRFRITSNTSQSTTDTNIIRDFPVRDASKSGFYMQPEAAGLKKAPRDFMPVKSNDQNAKGPPLPHRDSGNSERNRIASGLSFPSPSPSAPTAQPQNKSSDKQLPVVANFNGFNFDDDEQLPVFHGRPLAMLPNHRAQDSETLPATCRWRDLQNQAVAREPSLQRPSTAGKGRESAAYTGRLGADIKARNVNVNQNARYADEDGASIEDDLYFDDGGFDQDIRRPPSAGAPLNEDVFDDPGFLKRDGSSHMRDRSDVTVTSVSSDGPYPTFAMGSNSARVLQRQSQLLLEDLPLQSHNDPKLLPQRNPSEDAKRLGLSPKVPPLPPPPGNKEAHMQMQHNLGAYHAALANAANKAAADGRFARAPSVSTTRSDEPREDDESVYSEDLTDESGKKPTLDRSLSINTSLPAATQPAWPTLGKTSFDFGFGNDFGERAPLEDYDIEDDDIIAAANAEALAIDEDGFYGQEFDFYAKARPSSSGAESINGGYFGEDGDDGLARNMSFKEPNLTPITERSEFSTRNSFVHVGHGCYGPPSVGPLGPNSPSLTRLPISPLLEHEATSFDQLRQLRKNAFGGSSGSLQSEGKSSASRSMANQSPTLGARLPVFAPQHQYFIGPSLDSSGSSGPSPVSQQNGERPQSGISPVFDPDATPRKDTQPFPEPPRTVRKTSSPTVPLSQLEKPRHTPNGSDSVTYVREEDPSGNGAPRWVLERRRTSQQGQLELVGREVVQNGWI